MGVNRLGLGLGRQTCSDDEMGQCQFRSSLCRLRLADLVGYDAAPFVWREPTPSQPTG